mgnify:CR=1 FL=1
MAFEKGNRPDSPMDAEEKKFVYSVEKKITKSITKMWLN